MQPCTCISNLDHTIRWSFGQFKFFVVTELPFHIYFFNSPTFIDTVEVAHTPMGEFKVSWMEEDTLLIRGN